MRYALTYWFEDSWESVDTIVIDTDQVKEEGGWRWYDDETRVADILSAYGLDSDQTAEVINNGWYYIRNADDIDFYVNEKGELV